MTFLFFRSVWEGQGSPITYAKGTLDSMSLSFNRKLILIFGYGSWTFQGNAGLKRFFKDHLLCLINIPSHPLINTQDAMRPLFVHVKWLKQQVVGADINWALLSNPKGRNGEATRHWTVVLQTQAVRCKSCQSAHLQTVTEAPRCYSPALCSTWLSWSLVFVCLTVYFLDCFRMPHPSSSEGLRVWCWHLMVSLPRAVWPTQKLIWLCQADNKCCKGPEDQESWRMNLCHLPWCPGRCLHDWSPYRALGELSSEIKNKRFPKKH